MKQLILYSFICLTLMANSCAQTNKTTANTSKEKTETVTTDKKSEVPDVTASSTPSETTKPTDAQSTKSNTGAQSTKPAKDAQSPTQTTANNPGAYDNKEKQTTETSNGKKESLTTGTDPILFALNEQFGLRLNQSAFNKRSETGLEVLAIRDNRCPVGVNCFRAGEVEIDLKVNNKEVTLTFPTAEKPGSTNKHTVDQLTVKLLGASRKGRPDLSKPGGGTLKGVLGGIEVYLIVDNEPGGESEGKE